MSTLSNGAAGMWWRGGGAASVSLNRRLRRLPTLHDGSAGCASCRAESSAGQRAAVVVHAGSGWAAGGGFVVAVNAAAAVESDSWAFVRQPVGRQPVRFLAAHFYILVCTLSFPKRTVGALESSNLRQTHQPLTRSYRCLSLSAIASYRDLCSASTSDHFRPSSLAMSPLE